MGNAELKIVESQEAFNKLLDGSRSINLINYEIRCDIMVDNIGRIDLENVTFNGRFTLSGYYHYSATFINVEFLEE